MKKITSRSNPKLKMWRSLLESKGIKREGLCLVGGKKIVAELSKRPGLIVEYIVPPKANAPTASEPFKGSQIPATQLAADPFNELDVSGTKSPLAVVKCPALAKWGGGVPQGLQVIAALSDPQNLGALIRSCEAFGVDGVILAQESASPFLPRAIRASSGSVFRVPLYSGPSIHKLSIERAFGLDMEGRNINEMVWPRDMYLVLGEEGQGLPEDLKATRISIPMRNSLESLNAVAAGAIALFSYRQRFPLI
jgi:TrmH family RNA methyltransferase